MPRVVMALKKATSTQKPGQDGVPIVVTQLVLEGVIEDDDTLADLQLLQKQPQVVVSIDEVPKLSRQEKNLADRI
jgi:predicted transcriptional regulator